MKPRATLLALFALTFLSIDAAAQSVPVRRDKTATVTTPVGGFERRKLLTLRGKTQEVEYGSIARRTLLTTGKLPAACKKKPERWHR